MVRSCSQFVLLTIPSKVFPVRCVYSYCLYIESFHIPLTLKPFSLHQSKEQRLKAIIFWFVRLCWWITFDCGQRQVKSPLSEKLNFSCSSCRAYKNNLMLLLFNAQAFTACMIASYISRPESLLYHFLLKNHFSLFPKVTTTRAQFHAFFFVPLWQTKNHSENILNQ